MKKIYLLLLSIYSFTGNAQNISTVAGTGIAGYTGNGAAATSAKLYSPASVFVDGTGNIFIAEVINHVIRKVTASTGFINTVAGTGTGGYSGNGAAATSAKLYQPYGVFVDGAGNIFIAEYGNHVIRKVTASTGIISTVAGTGTGGYSGDGGAATSAKLNGSTSVFVDGAGNIFIAEYNNHVIRKVTASTGIISTVAGTGGTVGYSGDGGAATSATLKNPSGVFVDGAGNIFISEEGNHVIRKVTASTGNISTVAGTGIAGYSGDGAAATSATLNWPESVFVNSAGDIFIADGNNSVIRKVTASTGFISTVAGTGIGGYSGDGAAATSAQLKGPYGVFVDASGNIFIADYYNNVIRKVTASTLPLTWLTVAASLQLGNTGMVVWDVNELNIKSYTVQSSTDAVNWVDIGTVPAKGNGNQHYSFKTANTLTGNTFFRVQSKEENGGRLSFSSITNIIFATTQSFSCSPNPVTGQAILSFPKQTKWIKVMDVSGKIVLTIYPNTVGTITANFNSLAKGMYFIITDTGNFLNVQKQ